MDQHSKDIGEFLEDVDWDKVSELLNSSPEDKSPKIETIDFLMENLNVDKENVKYPNTFLRNYIYTTVTIRRHLEEIRKRQQSIEKRKKKIEHDSYEWKKLEYFYKRNQDAKEEIVQFICCKMSSYVADIRTPYGDLIDKRKEQTMWLLGPTYDYQYNSQFYDPDYDYSVVAKFDSIPGVSIFDRLKNVERLIALKKETPETYYQEIVKTVETNNLVASMSDRVKNTYHLHMRHEIFSTMVTLFSEGKYLAFITTATIQLEGMFYDLICIKHGKKAKQGTLAEKVEKAFANNRVLMQRLYPYFAFEIPELRNEIAHNGIVLGRDLKLLAYELVLDTNCVLSLAERASMDKFSAFLLINDKLNAVNRSECQDHDEYQRKVSQQLLVELFGRNMFQYEFFWDLLLNPEDYDDEMSFYMPQEAKEGGYEIKPIVYAISNLTKSPTFWDVVLEACSDISAKDKSFIAFIEMLKTKYIGLLNGDAKEYCCKVNAQLAKIKCVTTESPPPFK